MYNGAERNCAYREHSLGILQFFLDILPIIILGFDNLVLEFVKEV